VQIFTSVAGLIRAKNIKKQKIEKYGTFPTGSLAIEARRTHEGIS
jgi:hypothetical protein